MVSKKKAFFTKAKRFIDDIIPGVNDEEGRTPAERRQISEKWHEQLLKQKGITEFLETVKKAKSVKVKTEKYAKSGNYNVDIWYIFGKDDRYCVNTDNFIVVPNHQEEMLRLDGKLCSMIRKRVQELNQEDLVKAEQEKQKWDGKRYLVWPKKAFRESNR